MAKKAAKRKTEPPSCSEIIQYTNITSVRWKVNPCILSHLSKTTHPHPQMTIRVVQTKPHAFRRRIGIRILLDAKNKLPDKCQSTPIAVWFLVVSVLSPSAAVALLQSFDCVHPYIVQSSIPNLVCNELNEISVENGQISLSVSRNDKKSRSPGCSTLAIIDGDIGEQTLNSGIVERNVLLKFSWKSGIIFQEQTKGELATIHNTREYVRSLTYRVSSDCPLNSAVISDSCCGDRDYQRKRWELKSNER